MNMSHKKTLSKKLSNFWYVYGWSGYMFYDVCIYLHKETFWQYVMLQITMADLITVVLINPCQL